MKKLILTIILLQMVVFLVSCKNESVLAPPPPPISPTPMDILAWGKEHSDWTKWIFDALEKETFVSGIKSPCKTSDIKYCLAHAISKMAQYESSFNPNTLFEECSAKKETYSNGVWFEQKKKWCMTSSSAKDIVTSRGLLQISKDSANGYGCKITDPKQLNDPKINLECAVKIAAKWVNRDKVFFGETKLGIGRYWSVGRVSSKSNIEIINYLKEIK